MVDPGSFFGDQGGQTGDGGLPEQVFKGNVRAEHASHRGNRTGSLEAVAPELEEVIEDTDPLQPQHIAPNMCDLPLGTIPWRLLMGVDRTCSRVRQSRELDLPVVGQRKADQGNQVGWEHGTGKLLGKVGFQGVEIGFFSRG